MRRRNGIGSTDRTSSPSTVIVPASASISRFASRNSVVLPEPEPPTMARNSPPATSSETSSTALTRPPSKLLPTWEKTIGGGFGILRDHGTFFTLPWRGGSGMLHHFVELVPPRR